MYRYHLRYHYFDCNITAVGIPTLSSSRPTSAGTKPNLNEVISAMSASRCAPCLSSDSYEPVPFHFKIPHGLFMLEATSVAVDAEDNVIVFNRGNMPVLVFDREGNLIRKWGNPAPFAGTETIVDSYGGETMRWLHTEYARPHMCHVDAEGFIWLVDAGANCVVKCTAVGERVLVLCPNGSVLTGAAAVASAGVTYTPAERQSGVAFNTPTACCVHPQTGDIFVSDGYGNSRVHRFDRHGAPLLSWGLSGTDDGRFNLPHAICLLDARTVLVADRENSRVQAFTVDGEHLRSFASHRAVAVTVGRGANGPRGEQTSRVFIAEQGSSSTVQRGDGMGSHQLQTWTKHIGHRIGIYEVLEPAEGDSAQAKRQRATEAAQTPPTLRMVGQIGAATPGEAPEHFNWLHSIAVDSEGSVYVAEVSFCECGKFQKPHAREMVSLRKWRLVR